MDYQRIVMKAGATRPFRALAIADVHLLFADGRDNRAKYDIALRRYGEYVYSNIGRNVPYFLDALLYAREHCDMLWISGDLIDFVSEQNLEVAEKLLALSGVDYFMCAGNHEYTHYSGQHPETPEEIRTAREVVPPRFRNDINFSSRTVNGVNLLAIYNGDLRFGPELLEKFNAEAAKRLPMVVLLHCPLYTPGLRRFLRDAEAEEGFLPGDPATPSDAATEAFIGRLKTEPLLRGIVAGHLHAHRNYADELAPGTTQIVLGGSYYGCGAVIEITP